ncbi:Fanconi anemia core complex-associated protein 20 [Caloenas nicobarica]|uniref:Fanconi anemia core complex-associated protein 20 n=1 Tax=Caloenas nicobarica TaxID=187106 RepID=UPI0032B739E1
MAENSTSSDAQSGERRSQCTQRRVRMRAPLPTHVSLVQLTCDACARLTPGRSGRRNGNAGVRQGGAEGGAPEALPWRRARREEDEEEPAPAPPADASAVPRRGGSSEAAPPFAGRSEEAGPRASAMSEDGAAKLRLKPRKAPAAWSREPSPGREPPRRRQALADRCSWFEKDNTNECEKPWILLLKDLQCANGQTVPSFPEFLGKSSEEESLQKQEVFTVRMKDFQWVSFPPFCREKHPKPQDLGCHQLTWSQIHHLHKGRGQADKLKSLPATAEKTCCVTIPDQAKNVVGEDTEGVSKLEASKLTQPRNSTRDLASSQSSAEAFSSQQQCRGTAEASRKNRQESGGEELQIPTNQGNVSLGEATSVPAEQKPPLVNGPGTESCKEKTEQSEGSSTLDSCPMCLIRFSGTLSQLDIDGHLAQCLSESADDVMW